MQNTVQNVNNGELYKAIHHFNWGAFCFGFLWGLGNGCLKKVILLEILSWILCIIPIIGLIFVLGMKIYFGINGNQWAFDGRAWASIYDFEDTQRRWGIATAVVFCIISALILIVLILIATIGSLFAGLH